MDPATDVTGVFTHYQTPDLINEAVRSFLAVYPSVRTLIVDNGSGEPSIRVIDQLDGEFDAVTPVYLTKNRGHGPAMHLAMRHVQTDWAFFLDSDTVTKDGGFLDEMLQEAEQWDSTAGEVYGIGQRICVNRRGFRSEEGTPVLNPAYMLIDAGVYPQLPPFEHHGLPVLTNMQVARKQGYALIDFPLQDYIVHHGRGTVGRYGYGLGWRSKVRFLLEKLGL